MTACIRSCFRLITVVGLLAALPGRPAGAQGVLSGGRDPDDGALDISEFLATSYGFLPVITPVTEPAVGIGAAGALAYFHRPRDWDIDSARVAFETGQRIAPPSISAVFGMYTSNKSWLVGGAHSGYWGNGRWRYLGTAAVLGLNLSVAATLPDGEDVVFDYSLDGWIVTQALRYKLGKSDWLVGPLFDYMQMKTVFPAERLPGSDPLDAKVTLGSLGLSVRYDGRNSVFTPDNGIFADVGVRRRDDFLGSDFEYWFLRAKLYAYVNPLDWMVLGARVDGGVAGEEAPFWARPSVNLRGVSRGRYTGETAGALETELRIDWHRRWSTVAFGGAGWTTVGGGDDGSTRWVAGGGAGIRYLLARAFGLRSGLDVAYGTDGWAVYVITGSAWPAM